MPPPPPPAPPPPFFPTHNDPAKLNRSAQPDRNALLSQIRGGTHLKKCSTNDRSSPIIDGSSKTSGSSSGKASGISNGPTPLIPPGGLFAQGIPKLRPVGGIGRSGQERPNQPQVNIRPSGSFAFREECHSSYNQSEVIASRSHPTSPAFKLRQTSSPNRLEHSLSTKSHYAPGGIKRPPFPSDVPVKGPAPVPPCVSQKQNSGLDSSKSLTDVNDQNHGNSFGQSRPGVRRSVSQTSLGPKTRPGRPPPSVKPPPPPKSSMTHNGPPAPPSKPPNLFRRQSFGVGDFSNGPMLGHHQPINNDLARLNTKSFGPPPPPRNNSAPNNLHQMNQPGNQSACSKMTSAPPPPPSRLGVGPSARPPNVRPPPPPVKTLPAPPPPPPPPPHCRVGNPAPPSQTKVAPPINQGTPPPPPARVSSARGLSSGSFSAGEFESRFYHMFHGNQELPPPDRYINTSKNYPSKLHHHRASRRQPPPPPPTIGNGSINMSRGDSTQQPVLHIQLESRMFPNNIAHC